jgi:hypothetical protein
MSAPAKNGDPPQEGEVRGGVEEEPIHLGGGSKKKRKLNSFYGKEELR